MLPYVNFFLIKKRDKIQRQEECTQGWKGFCTNKGFDWKISRKIIIIKRWEPGSQIAKSAPDSSSFLKLWSYHVVSAEGAGGMVAVRPAYSHFRVLGLE